MPEGMAVWRIVVSGVLLGIAGAAVLEFAKNVLHLALIQLSPLEIEVYGTLVYISVALVAVMLAALALRASALGTAVYAFPISFFALAVIGTVLVIGSEVGLLSGTSTGDVRLIGRSLAILGGAVLVLGASSAIHQELAAASAWLYRRFRKPAVWIGNHLALSLGTVGALLLAVGMILGR